MNVFTGDNKQHRVRLPFSHRVMVPPGDQDMLGVAANAHYLAYMEDAVDAWFVAALGPAYRQRFEAMARRVDVHWAAPAQPGDTIGFAIDVPRWGRKSFDVHITGWVRGQRVVEATMEYGVATPDGREQLPVPVNVKHALAAALMGL